MNATLTSAFSAAALALGSALAHPAAHAAEPVEQLWFTDSQQSAFYAIDEASHRVTVQTQAGPKGDAQARTLVRELADGEGFTLSVDGQDGNDLTATLTVRRQGERLEVDVVTTARQAPQDRHLLAQAASAASGALN